MSQPTAIVLGVGSVRGVGGAVCKRFAREGYDAIADNYWLLHRQPKSAWPQKLDLRPFKENW